MAYQKQPELEFAAVGSRIVTDKVPDDTRVDVFSLGDGAGQSPGVAVLAAFYGGQKCLLRFRIRLAAASSCRIEVHGLATRLQKAVVLLDASGAATCGEEIEAADVTEEQGELSVTLTFTPHRSIVEWIYVFGRDVAESEGPLFSISGVSLSYSDSEPAALRRRHQSVREIGEVFAACQAMTVLNGCFHLHVEIHDPGRKLVGLKLQSHHEIAHVRWWTWRTEKLSPAPGELVAERSEHPISSPGLMDAFGSAHANDGHAISGIFAKWQDVERMPISDSDALREMSLTARFDDSSIAVLPLLALIERAQEEDALEFMIRKYLEDPSPPSSPLPSLVEVGGRGEASAYMRGRLSPRWNYVALDNKPGTNVDLVGDAHRLSEVLAPESVQAIFSAEVMEHLMSPLRFVMEANRVLALGGLFIARMPTTWPLHAEPWDFWRISKHGWPSILNRNTGFEILECHESDSAAIVPFLPQVSGSTRMASAPAPMETVVVARKVSALGGDTSGWSDDLSWGDYDHA